MILSELRRLWYPEMGAVTGVGSSGGMCSGMLDSGFVWHT